MSNSRGQDVETAFRPLSDTERDVLSQLLNHDFPGSAALREQMAHLLARRIDADGSLAFEPVGDACAAQVGRRIPVEAELKDLDGATVHVLLHVLNGRMNELEIYREDSAPLQVPIASKDLRVLVL